MPSRKELPGAVQALLAGAAVAGAVLLLHFAGAFRQLELKTRDIRMRVTRPPKGDPEQFDHPEIGMILITDDCLERYERDAHRSWPWQRDVLSVMFRGCALGPARAILFDMFTHVDKDS